MKIDKLFTLLDNQFESNYIRMNCFRWEGDEVPFDGVFDVGGKCMIKFKPHQQHARSSCSVPLSEICATRAHESKRCL